jgi:hypothetical protein
MRCSCCAAPGKRALNREASNEARRIAIKNLLDSAGIDAILSLFQLVQFPALVGKALAETATEVITDATLVDALQVDDYQSWNFAHGIIVTFNTIKGESWSDCLIDRALAQGWTRDSVLRILLSLPKSEHFMRRASEIGGEIEQL